ncbi:MAG: sigma-70 family RNA polymerase sigma factor [Oscillospiraceae bacterium]|nr:sigma-70 family RNA polymerase sigma factor [Oscillospiraceae bacterium]
MSVATLDKENLEKLFYFSLKKTGNPYEAEELVQETALEMLKMLNKNYKPDNFTAWMWTVVRKRYARWCKNKHMKLSRYEIENVYDYAEIADEEQNIEENILFNEDIELLRRELALMAKDYRDIVVSYYFDGKKIEAISKVTGLPEGTIKRKLHEARKNIKEGMKMARTKGQRSFAPEDIDFGFNVEKASEGYPLGAPWNLLKKLAAKNIVLETYNNPSTVEELSIALGIASPYIEDELKYLLDPGLMIKHSDGRIETNFIILDAETQKQLIELGEETGRRISPLICETVEKYTDKIREIGFINSDMPTAYLYWSLLYITIEKLISKVHGEKNIENYATERPNGDKWDITGFENWDSPIKYSSTVNRTNDGNSHFDHFTIDVADLYKTAADYNIPGDSLVLLTNIIRNNRKKSTLDTSENRIIDSLVTNHVVTISGDTIKTGFPVFNESEKHEFTAYHDIVREIYEGDVFTEFKNTYNSVREIISGSLPARFKDNITILKEAAGLLSNFRCILLRYAYDKGIIKIPDGDDKSAVTMYMTF